MKKWSSLWARHETIFSKIVLTHSRLGRVEGQERKLQRAALPSGLVPCGLEGSYSEPHLAPDRQS